MTTFDELVHGLFADLFRASPVFATWIGNHDHDGEWPDQSEAGVAGAGRPRRPLDRGVRRAAAADLVRDEPSTATSSSASSRRCASPRSSSAPRRGTRWPGCTCWATGSTSCWPASSPRWAYRLASAADRIEGIPAVLATARERLVGMPGRPVSRLHAEVALGQLSGIGDLCRRGPRRCRRRGRRGRAGAGPDPPRAGRRSGRGRPGRVRRAPARRRPSGGGGRRPPRSGALRGEAPPHAPDRDDARRPGGSGPARVRRGRRRDGPPGARAVAGPRPRRGAPRTTRTLVRGALDAIAERAPGARRAPRLLPRGARPRRGLLPRAERHRPCRGAARDRAGRRPSCGRSAGRCSMPPGPARPGPAELLLRDPAAGRLDARAGRVVPPRGQRPDARDAGRSTRPCRATTSSSPTRTGRPSFVRAAFSSGVFAEGWAVYVTQVMMDLGYAADDPALLLVHWKLYLRAVTNALIDVGIHVRGMTEEEAVGLMVDGGFQERSEAVKKYERARLTSTQLCDVLRRLGRDVGPRGGTAPAAGAGLGRPARRGRRAGPPRRRRVRRDAGLRLPGAPRSGPGPRDAADPGAAGDPARRSSPSDALSPCRPGRATGRRECRRDLPPTPPRRARLGRARPPCAGAPSRRDPGRRSTPGSARAARSEAPGRSRAPRG